MTSLMKVIELPKQVSSDSEIASPVAEIALLETIGSSEEEVSYVVRGRFISSLLSIGNMVWITITPLCKIVTCVAETLVFLGEEAKIPMDAETAFGVFVEVRNERHLIATNHHICDQFPRLWQYLHNSPIFTFWWNACILPPA